MSDVIEYVVEEVMRQGHDIYKVDGIERVGWMLQAWSYAIHRAKWNAPLPTVEDAIRLGQMIEPQRNPGLRCANVMTRTPKGVHRFPDFAEVPSRLAKLFQQMDVLTPLEFYKEFETVHPFMDGNGRTGKVLLNWLAETLHDPFFPPADLFGEPIRNP